MIPKRDLSQVSLPSPPLSGNSQRKKRKSSRLRHREAPRSLPRSGRREQAGGGERLLVLFQRGFLHFLAGSSTQACLFRRKRNVLDFSGGGGEGKTKIICPAFGPFPVHVSVCVSVRLQD